MRSARRLYVAILIARMFHPSAAFATSFHDDFDRPNGPVGNGWSNAPGDPDGGFVIRNGALVPSKVECSVGINRPIGYSSAVSVSLPMTQQNGFGGLKDRYVAGIVFKNDGTLRGGYGVIIYRGDQNYDNSAVELDLNGVVIGSIPSTFQFGAWIRVDLRLFPDGRIWGRVRGDGHEFTFAFPKHSLKDLPGQSFALLQACPDARQGQVIFPRINDLSLDYDTGD
jgi:hypothetical protein